MDVARSEDCTVATWLRSWYELYAKPNVRQVSIPQDAVDLLIQEHSKHPEKQSIKLFSSKTACKI